MQYDGVGATRKSFVGRHYHTDKANRYEIFPDGYIKSNGQVWVDKNAPVLCESKDGSQVAGAVWTCEFTYQEDTNDYGCQEFSLKIK